MRFLNVGFGIWLGILAVWLTIALAIALSIYIDEESSTYRALAVIGGGIGGASIAAICTIFFGKAVRGIYLRRRWPLAWIAVKIIRVASGKIRAPIPARGISDRNGNLAVGLIISHNDYLSVGDLISATNINTRRLLGTLEITELNQDLCLCELVDRMDSNEFWVGLESRMLHSFCPPSGVEFSRHVDPAAVDFVERLIRSWGG